MHAPCVCCARQFLKSPAHSTLSSILKIPVECAYKFARSVCSNSVRLWECVWYSSLITCSIEFWNVSQTLLQIKRTATKAPHADEGVEEWVEEPAKATGCKAIEVQCCCVGLLLCAEERKWKARERAKPWMNAKTEWILVASSIGFSPPVSIWNVHKWIN